MAIGGYDKDGNYKLGGVYSQTGLKVGYDEDDMKNGISDVNTPEFQDPRYIAREDEHLKRHPAVNPKAGVFHPGIIDSYQQLLNTHGGVRNENAIRTDIRHGFNILQQRHPKGVEGGIPHWHAESVGYEARKHLYIQAEQAAAKKAAPVDNTAGRSQQFKFTAETPSEGNPTQWDTEPSAPARTPAPKTKSSKPKPYRDPNDTIGGAIKHVIGKLREKH